MSYGMVISIIVILIALIGLELADPSAGPGSERQGSSTPDVGQMDQSTTDTHS